MLCKIIMGVDSVLTMLISTYLSAYFLSPDGSDAITSIVVSPWLKVHVRLLSVIGCRQVWQGLVLSLEVQP